MTGKHVFLSYCRENREEVSRLRDYLIAKEETVWWDQDIMPGQNWNMQIRKAMKHSYAVILCLSTEMGDRLKSGMYPEIANAVSLYHEYAPGSVFLLPVRLSDCEIPMIEINATNTLDSLQYVDLFPPEKRAEGLRKLLASLKNAPEHP